MNIVTARGSAKSSLSLPNILTYARIAAIPVVVGCIYVQAIMDGPLWLRWVALAVFIAAGVTDFLDGYYARIWDQHSAFGRMLDPIADKLLVASCLLMLAADGIIHGWTLWAAIVILCREILVSGLREYLAALRVSVPVTRLANPESGWPDPSGPALLTIQSLDPIYTDFTVAEPDLPLVRRYLGGPNVKVETKSEDDNVPARTGDLYFIDNAVQPGAGTVKARAVTPNADRALWPSQFVRVRLILDILKEAKLVPNGAVQIGQNGPYVFVVKQDSTLDLRPVKAGQRQGDLMVITDGLKPGEIVVTSGQLQLAPGTKVVAQPIEAGRDGSGAASNAALN
jgi:CDP-diacylglycerol--glycerol-3-phosphate 3-phosphatidyltransferase